MAREFRAMGFKTADEKTLPGCIFKLERQQIGLFLNRLFAIDGWA